jgi:hypothetical protein
LNEWTEAAGDDAEKAIQAHWNLLAGAHDELKSTKRNCEKSIAFGVVNLTASALAIAASFGTAAPAYVKLLTSLGGIVSNVLTLCKSADSAATDLTKTIAQLQKELKEKTSKLGAVKIVASEVASILGMPFLNTCESGEAKAKVLSGKCAELDENVKDMMGEAEEGLKFLALMEKTASMSTAKKVKDLQTDHGKLMEKITNLLSAELPYFDLVEDAKKTIEAYKVAKDVKWAASRYALKLGGEASAAKTVLDNLKTVAMAVASTV